MTFDPKLPVQTRDGQKARIICTDRRNARPIIALVDDGDNESSWQYNEIGRLGGGYEEQSLDLINIPETRWANIYPDGSTSPRCHFDTRGDADRSACHDRIACLEFSEGDGL